MSQPHQPNNNDHPLDITHSNMDVQQEDEDWSDVSTTSAPYQSIPFYQRFQTWLLRFKKQTKRAFFHRKQGKSFICFSTVHFWMYQFIFLFFLYALVCGFFMAYMSIGSELMPFTFIVYKERNATAIPLPVPTRDYFGSMNSTGIIIQPLMRLHCF